MLNMIAAQILLVDDETDLIAPLAQALKREGYTVDVAMDGESALDTLTTAKAEQRPYRLVILDWMLPHCSGIEVCRTLRQQADLTPVLFLTAKDTLDDRVQGLDVGADDYLIKPFELRELLARVRALLRRQEQLKTQMQPQETEERESSQTPESSESRIFSEGLELDLETQMAYRAGRAIALSDKECQLLEYLMAHPQAILTHEEIYEHLWSQGEKPGSNVLAAQMRLLRRKIETDQEPSLIHTIYGKGYRFGLDA
ncbi:MAG: two-component system response regulator RppA [Cyanobacteria bacterium P01_F01_bin.42]